MVSITNQNIVHCSESLDGMRALRVMVFHCASDLRCDHIRMVAISDATLSSADAY